MSLRDKFSKLIQHYEIKKSHCTTEMNGLKRCMDIVEHDIAQLEREKQDISLIINTRQLTGIVDLIRVFDFQRQEAVLKRKIAYLTLQLKEMLLKKDELQQQTDQIKMQLKFYNFKQQKYLLLNVENEKNINQQINFIEESTIEELIYGKVG